MRREPHPAAGRLKLLAALVLLALPAAAGCRRAGPPLPEPEFRRRVADFASERARLASFSASYDMTVSGRRPGGASKTVSFSGVLVAQGARLRMRGEKVLGMAKVFDLLLDGPEFRVSYIHGGKFFRGHLATVAEPRGAAGFLDSRGALDLAALLLPAPAIDGPGAPELTFGRREVEALWRARPDGPVVRRTVFAADTGAVLLTELRDASGRTVLTLACDEPRESFGLHPVSGFRLSMEQPARLRLDVSFKDVEVNGPVKEAAFALEPPEGFEVVDLDRSAGNRVPAGSGREP